MRADRLLRIFKRNITKLHDSGMALRIIEDAEFHGESIVLDGEKLWNFGLCSYLSLGDDERVKQGARDALDRFGASYSSSFTYTALPLYGELADRLDQVFGADVVVTGTTTLGHLAALPVLIRSGDRVLVDQQTHMSVMTATQGLQASGTSVTPLPHNDVGALESAIQEDDHSDRIWYLTDGVFSMYGDSSNAEALKDLLFRYPRLHIYCDDAHGFGWAGTHGRGRFLERFGGWHERLVVIVGLSKAFGSLGGAIATPDSDVAQMIRLCGPSLMFGGPIPPASLGASVASADILLSDELPDLQAELMERIRLVNRLASELGLELVSTDETPLWFHDVGGMEEMLHLLTAMRDSGFFLNGSAFPAVPIGHAGIRFTVTVDNSLEQIEDMLMCLNEKRLELFGETDVEVDLTRLESEPEMPAAGDSEASS